jgi:hypothetical protein
MLERENIRKSMERIDDYEGIMENQHSLTNDDASATKAPRIAEIIARFDNGIRPTIIS